MTSRPGEKRRTVIDPEFGPLEVPPPPSKEDFERAAKVALAAVKRRGFWPPRTQG